LNHTRNTSNAMASGDRDLMRQAKTFRLQQRDAQALGRRALLGAEGLEDLWLARPKPQSGVFGWPQPARTLESKQRFLRFSRENQSPPRVERVQLCYCGPAPTALMSLARAALDDRHISSEDMGKWKARNASLTRDPCNPLLYR